MSWFMNLKTGAKILLSFALVIILQIAIIVISYRSMNTLHESQEKINDLHVFEIKNLIGFLENIDATRFDLFTMMISKNPSELENLKKNISASYPEGINLLKQLHEKSKQYNEDQGKIQLLETKYASYQEIETNQVIPLILSGNVEKAFAMINDKKSDFLDDIRQTTEDLVSHTQQFINDSLNASSLQLNKSIQLLISIGVISVIMAIIVTLILTRMISNPLRNISSVSKHIAKGDLSQNVNELGRTDEFGDLSTSFQDMITNLRKITSEITDAINFLGSSATEISSTTGQLAASASQIATAVSETTTTIEEIKQTSQVTNQKAKSVSESSEKSALASEAGKQAASDIRDMISRIQSQMTLIAESMVRLNEQSQAIGMIISTVDDLAQQSNLLSVNASIEAAKAGEHGKGFSVVAQEVKSLAAQSKEATSQVRGILSDIQKATSAAVMATEQGGKSVEAGVKKCAETSDSILQLVSSVTGASQAATQIAASSHQQLVGMEQAAIAMENIKQASAQNVESTSQLKTAAHRLKDMGDKLKQLISVYKLSQDAN